MKGDVRCYKKNICLNYKELSKFNMNLYNKYYQPIE